MVTGGEGRKQQLVFRYRTLDPDQKAIPTDKPLLLAANDDRTEANGFYRVSMTGCTPAEDDHARQIVRRRHQGQEARTAWSSRLSRFDEFPDLWVSDTSFRDMKKVSNANPQQAEYVWGKTELMQYTNADGKTLRAILAKPDNFDPSKKYPLMVYIYEELSEGLHTYRAPNPGTSINITRYVSNGYVVLHARHRLRHRLSRRERREVRDPGGPRGRGHRATSTRSGLGSRATRGAATRSPT